ncbi:hypothetical protein [Vibrio variabilis]|uniref:hypothetical protein n=1 Tax=Vibrio variabilis TaxID=990271 RepID=UPI000DDBF2EB|nr:hypothetical protein [Vibrio variabilis]
MNKKMLVALLSSTLGMTSAFAEGEAILNVEGEIQINGQTVIDSSGQVLGLDFVKKEQALINDYFVNKNGVFTYIDDSCVQYDRYGDYHTTCKSIVEFSNDGDTESSEDT